jgi:hypothetical protein
MAVAMSAPRARVHSALATLQVVVPAVIVTLLLARLADAVTVYCNDDTYVYFNYARNIVAGRPLAYDSRGIRSEGFSSPLYLLMLVPFEYLGVSMMWAAIVLQLVCLAASIALATALVAADGLLPPALLGPFAVLLTALLTKDASVRGLLGWGLDTFLGTASLLLALLLLVLCCRTGSSERALRARTAAFFGACGVAYLARPDHLLPLAAAALVLLARHPRRDVLLRHAAWFALALAGYHALKWRLIGDPFPTGYYRKLGAAGLPGAEYVAGALREYGPHLALTLALGLALFARDRSKGRTSWFLTSRAAPAAAAAVIAAVALNLQVNPIVGHHWRFLATPIVLLDVFLAALLLAPLRSMAAGLEPEPSLRALPLAAAASALTLALVVLVLPGRNRLIDRVEQAVSSHLYLRLGAFLRRNVPGVEGLAIAYGDAGCLPYASTARLIDTNGLTEPPIAHLFRLRDPGERARRFADYLLSVGPDVILEPRLAASDDRATVPLVANPHSPLSPPSSLYVYQRYREAGYRYLCTLTLYYDVHVLVSPTSRFGPKVREALLHYASRGHGFVLPGGVAVRSGDREVSFDRVSP